MHNLRPIYVGQNLIDLAGIQIGGLVIFIEPMTRFLVRWFGGRVILFIYQMTRRPTSGTTNRLQDRPDVF